jgi:hypothetical protein
MIGYMAEMRALALAAGCATGGVRLISSRSNRLRSGAVCRIGAVVEIREHEVEGGF